MPVTDLGRCQKTTMRVPLGFVLLLSTPMANAATPVPATQRVGLASVVERKAEAALDRVVRTLVLRDALFRNERLTTGAEPGSKLHVRLLDQTVITLGPASEVVLDDFAVNPAAGSAEVSLKLSRGVLRFVGGQHAGSGTRYRVRTPVATIGVRGTAFDVRVGDDGETTVQLTEGELSFENEDGLEVILDEPLETSSIEDEDDQPSEPEVDAELAEEFDSLDLSEEELAEDLELAEELEDEEMEPISGEDADEDSEDFDDSDDFDDFDDFDESGADIAIDAVDDIHTDDEIETEDADTEEADDDAADDDAADDDAADDDAADDDAADNDAADDDAADDDAADDDAADDDAADDGGESEADGDDQDDENDDETDDEGEDADEDTFDED
jgi:hypothetical protein